MGFLIIFFVAVFLLWLCVKTLQLLWCLLPGILLLSFIGWLFNLH